MTELEPPTKYEQAQEAARDGVTRTELMNMLLTLPKVHEALSQGEEGGWRETIITVGFSDSPGAATAHVDELMRLAGWKSDGTSFALNRRHYVRREDTNE